MIVQQYGGHATLPAVGASDFEIDSGSIESQSSVLGVPFAVESQRILLRLRCAGVIRRLRRVSPGDAYELLDPDGLATRTALQQCTEAVAITPATHLGRPALLSVVGRRLNESEADAFCRENSLGKLLELPVTGAATTPAHSYLKRMVAWLRRELVQSLDDLHVNENKHAGGDDRGVPSFLIMSPLIKQEQRSSTSSSNSLAKREAIDTLSYYSAGISIDGDAEVWIRAIDQPSGDSRVSRAQQALRSTLYDETDYGDAAVCVNACPSKDNLDGRVSTFVGSYGSTIDPFAIDAPGRLIAGPVARGLSHSTGGSPSAVARVSPMIELELTTDMAQADVWKTGDPNVPYSGTHAGG